MLSIFVTCFLFFFSVPGLSFCTWDLRTYLWHVGSSSLTRDGNWAPCLGSAES